MARAALIVVDFCGLVVVVVLVQVPNVSWNDVGGLEDVKRELQETVQVSRRHYCTLFHRAGILIFIISALLGRGG